MGFSISWLAVKNESALSVLGLERTGKRAESPECDWCCARTRKGWIIAWSNSYDPALFYPFYKNWQGAFVICHIEEHLMFSSTEAWNSGYLEWRIEHDAELGKHHLAIEGGSLPRSFAKIRDAAMARVPEDPQCDFVFDVPADVAKQVVGFRYDDGSVEFEELRESKRRK